MEPPPSSSSKPNAEQKLYYASDAKLHGVMLLHRKAVDLQGEQLDALLTQQKLIMEKCKANKTLSSIVSDANSVENVLTKRRSVGGDTHRNNHRLIDDFEETLLGLLDGDGKLTNSSRTSQFIILMTRTARFDQRVLCLTVLLHATSEESAKEFVHLSGLRLLNRWLLEAALDDHVDEMSLIVKTCKKLPFSSKHVKDAEIGKTIKKLSKYASDDAPLKKVEGLKKDVESVMQLWIQKVQLEKSAVQATPKVDAAAVMPEVVREVSDLLVKERGLPKAAAASAASATAAAATAAAIEKRAQAAPTKSEPQPKVPASTPIVTTLTAEPNAEAAKVKTEAAAKVKTEAAPKPKDVPIKTVSSLLMASKMAAKPSPAPIVLSLLSSSADTSLSSPKAAEGAARDASSAQSVGASSSRAQEAQERRMAQFAEAAKKTLLVLKEEEEAAPRLHFHELDEDGASVVRLDLVPEKSCLKRPDGLDGDKAKKKRRVAVQWADENGESLRDVCTFEVEKIRQSTSGYKNHKDLVRREKQFEKEMNVSGIADAMQKNMEWKKPELLRLPMEVVENSQNPVTSSENEAQTRRCSQVMEARYLDETLIPPDPEDPPFSLDRHVLRAEIPSFPWDMPGAAGAAGTAAVAAKSFYDAPAPDAPMSSGAGFNMNSLPPALLALDADILQHVIMDPALVPSLLHENGTLNHSRVNVLRLSLMNSVQMQQQPMHFMQQPMMQQPMMQQPMMQQPMMQQPMMQQPMMQQPMMQQPMMQQPMMQQPMMQQPMMQQPMMQQPMMQQPMMQQSMHYMQQQWQEPMQQQQQQMYSSPNQPFIGGMPPNQPFMGGAPGRNQNVCLAFASGKGCFRASCPYKH